MPKFTANLSLLFTELDLIDRFKAAKNCGFKAVEIQFPYSLPAEQIKQILVDNQLKLVLFNIDADDLLQGGEGLAAVPEKQALFLEALDQCKTYAEILQPETINVLPGRCADKTRTTEYLANFIKNLSLALDTFAPMGIKTVFEAVNTMDMPDFIINSSQQMLDMVNQFNHPLLLMQYDIYHMQMMNEQTIPFIKQHADKIGHIQFADVPGRGQPGTGTIDFEQLFSTIDQSNYGGWVGAEYRPVGKSSQSLDWLKRIKPIKTTLLKT
ncbi:MAG: TIM barrel protein [Methylococcales bacterium]|nr:TIM barrel protein [Methylococcales bacterium]